MDNKKVNLIVPKRMKNCHLVNIIKILFANSSKPKKQTGLYVVILK